MKVPGFGGYFATGSNYNSKFKDLFPELKDKIEEVHHAIPQKLFNDQSTFGYLDITSDQMHSLQNLRGTSKAMHDEVDAHWTTWINNNLPPKTQTPPTLNEIKESAIYLDDVYGAYFFPPVR